MCWGGGKARVGNGLKQMLGVRILPQYLLHRTIKPQPKALKNGLPTPKIQGAMFHKLPVTVVWRGKHVGWSISHSLAVLTAIVVLAILSSGAR